MAEIFFSVYRVKVRSAPSPYQSEHRIFMFQSLYLVSTNFCVYVHQMIKERTVRRCQAVGECCRLDGLDLVKTLLEATDIKRKMKRSERMLSMAKAKSKVDEEIGRMLDIPKYETTKGLEATEIDLLLQVQHQLFNVVKVMFKSVK
ncbi:unnamed protein product [Tenebrio molitor]|nr:unnamed protein product [Tenebrio molitor]